MAGLLNNWAFHLTPTVETTLTAWLSLHKINVTELKAQEFECENKSVSYQTVVNNMSKCCNLHLVDSSIRRSKLSRGVIHVRAR